MISMRVDQQRVSLMVICLAATLVSACGRASNEERASFTKQGSTYLVEMKGQRLVMAHDPLSWIRGRTYQDTLTLQLPRIDGVVEGREIPVKPDKLRYTGRVVISNGRMKVELHYVNHDGKTEGPLPWNDEYTLVSKDTGGS
jgi:hypothetical protein